MNLKDAIRVLREQWKLPLALTLLGLVAGLLIGFLVPTTYTSNVKLYVSAQGQENSNSAYEGSLLSQQRVKSYTELVPSPRVAQESMTQLGESGDLEAFQRRISASSALDSVVIDIFVQGDSPQEAQRSAQTVGNVFSAIVTEIERPAQPGAIAPVATKVVQPATLSESPSSVGAPTLAGLGLVAGLLAGTLLVLLRQVLDDRVRSREQLEEVLKRSVLATIPRSESFRKHDVVALASPNSPEAEAYRQLRTNFDYLNVDGHSTAVVITSSHPGEGKTTSALNLAVLLAAAGRRVAVVDADLRKPRIGSIFGIDDAVGLSTVLTGRIGMAEALAFRHAERLSILPSGPLPPNPSELLGSERMRSLVANLKSTYDVVIIDSPPLLPVTDAAALAPQTDGVIICCSYKTTTVSQLQTSSESLTNVSARIFGSIFTSVPVTGGGEFSYYATPYTKPHDEPEGESMGSPRSERPQHDARIDAPTDTTLRPSPSRRPSGTR